jgi:hypothetical protein
MNTDKVVIKFDVKGVATYEFVRVSVVFRKDDGELDTCVFCFPRTRLVLLTVVGSILIIDLEGNKYYKLSFSSSADAASAYYAVSTALGLPQ